MTLKARYGVPKPVHSSGAGMNINFGHDYYSSQPFINVALNASVGASGSGQSNIESLGQTYLHATTRLPQTLPTNYDSIRMSFRWFGIGNGHPAFGDYEVRFTGLAQVDIDAVTVSGTGVVFRSDINGHRAITVPGRADWFLTIPEPAGGFPDGWTVEVVRANAAALYDNTALPREHATRNFTPEWIAYLKRRQHSVLRGMNMDNSSKDYSTAEIADLRSIDAYAYGSKTPLELQVSLCNEVGAGLHMCTFVRETDACLAYRATYIRDNLAAELPFIAETGNEIWNPIYRAGKFFSPLAMRKFGVNTPGTFTVVDGQTQINYSGSVDLTTLFGGGGVSKVSIGSYTYDINTALTTATQITTQGYDEPLLSEVVTVGSYHTSNSDPLLPEAATLKTKWLSDIVRPIFRETNQQQRLEIPIPVQFANTGTTQRSLDMTDWQSHKDYVPVERFADAVCSAPYLCSGHFNGSPTDTSYMQHLIDTYGVGSTEVNAHINEIFLETPYTIQDNVTVRSSTGGVPTMHTLAVAQNAMIHAKGLKHTSYEGQMHLIEAVLGGSLPDDFIDAYRAWLDSETSRTVFSAYFAKYREHYDGPLMFFGAMIQGSAFGFWCDVENYTDNNKLAQEYDTHAAVPVWF